MNLCILFILPGKIRTLKIMFSDEIVYFELITLFNDSFYDLKKKLFSENIHSMIKKKMNLFSESITLYKQLNLNCLQCLQYIELNAC